MNCKCNDSDARNAPSEGLIPPHGGAADVSGMLMGCQMYENSDNQNEKEATMCKCLYQSNLRVLILIPLREIGWVLDYGADSWITVLKKGSNG